MSITIKKDTGGAIFHITQPSGITSPYIVNDYRFIPETDGISFSLVSKYPYAIPDAPIHNQLFSNIINGDTSSAFTSLAAVQTYIETYFFRKPGGNAGSTSQTGAALSFTSDAIYGTTGTPETGNVTAVLTGALAGVSVLLLHNNGTAPTFGSEFKKLSSSGSYVTGVLNYIDCQYIDATHIRYSISQ